MSVWVKVGDRQIPSLTRLTTNPLFNPSRSENDNYSMFGKDVRKHIPAFCLPEKKKKKKNEEQHWEADTIYRFLHYVIKNYL